MDKDGISGNIDLFNDKLGEWEDFLFATSKVVSSANAGSIMKAFKVMSGISNLRSSVLAWPIGGG